MVVAMHNHSNTKDPNEFATPESFAAAMKLSKYFKVNLDIGHFTAANYDAVAYLKEHHASVTNLHIKDRKKNQGDNVPWGTGDTPIREVLQLLKREKWPIRAYMEYEHRGTAGAGRGSEDLLRIRQTGACVTAGPPSPRGFGAAGRIGMGLVGPGFVGAHHIDAVRRLGFVDVVAVAGSTEESARRKADALGVPKSYGSYEALARDPDVHVVHNTTPNYLHAPVIMAALAHRKHVVSDKPLAMTADRSARAARRGDAGRRRARGDLSTIAATRWCSRRGR